MKRGITVALVLACSLAALPRFYAQSPAAGGAAGSAPKKQAGDQQKPATGAPPSTSSANPFPEDTTTVPVLPSATTTAPAAGAGSSDTGFGRGSLSAEDADPVRSPDDPGAAAGSGQGEESSSSLKGMESLLPTPDSDQTGKKKKLAVKEPTHQEAAAEDVNVGGYYLEKKNWKAALSRFQSAMVLDPENPEVYWGLAEAERHLGNFADARAHYEKVAEYDPDSRHGKDARKALKEPEITNGTNAASSPPQATETAK